MGGLQSTLEQPDRMDDTFERKLAHHEIIYHHLKDSDVLDKDRDGRRESPSKPRGKMEAMSPRVH